MAAAAVKGIIISVSIITALGIAVYENPEIQRWIEEQRRKLVELLRGLGPELDPQSRREAEAFAFEGRTHRNDDSIRREMEASRDATAVATGRSNGPPSTVRRIPIRGPEDETAAEERRRKGREYLARRNQQMYELQQRKKTSGKEEDAATPPTLTHFDALVDEDGKLKIAEKELPSPPTHEPGTVRPSREMKESRSSLVEPLLASDASTLSPSSIGWQIGSRMADPFGDEFEMERSATPKPPVPPKIELTKPAPQHRDPPIRHEDLSYEEQIAIALSLSESENAKPSATVRQGSQDDADLSAAIAASLRDLDDQQAAHAIANADPDTPRLSATQQQPLVDLTPDLPTSAPQELPRGNWESLFAQPIPHEEPRAMDPPISVATPASAEDEDLYSATPQLTRARLATHDARQETVEFFDPVRSAAASHEQMLAEASFLTARSNSNTVSNHDASTSSPRLVDASEEPLKDTAQVPPQPESPTFHSDSDSDTFASLSAISRAPSVPRSEISHPAPPTPASGRSDIEVIDVEADSDVDMLSEEGYGVITPDSWTEVGSQDGESEVDSRERQAEGMRL